eukprot:TsM_000105900 transcript=TsM_000105900 gene=TsM_000105900
MFTDDELVFVMPSMGTYELQTDRTQVPQNEEYCVRVNRTKGRYNVAAKVQQEKDVVTLNSLEVEVGVGVLDVGCYVQPCSVCEVGSEFELAVVNSSREAVTITLRGDDPPAPAKQIVRCKPFIHFCYLVRNCKPFSSVNEYARCWQHLCLDRCYSYPQVRLIRA